MNPLIAKEIRLILPAFGLALVLAIAPVWLVPQYWLDGPVGVSFHPFWFGLVLLALSPFGREFGLRTFSIQMAQPVERARIWRTKVTVLGGASAIVLAAWCASCRTSLSGAPPHGFWGYMLLAGITAAVVSVSGGLWSALLVRQVVGAFWFTLLIPMAVVIAIGLEEDRRGVLLAALAAFSVGGFWWASRYFLRAEEAGWTGGVVMLPGVRGAAAKSGAEARRWRPLAALVGKEIRLHQIAMVGMGSLVLAHIGAIMLSRSDWEALSPSTRAILEGFGAVWAIAPLLVGCASVAEERKLGTLQEHLCLPVSRGIQIALKIVVVVAIGALLSATLCGVVEVVGGGRNPKEAAVFLGIFTGLALTAFYASTLTANILQALGTAVLMAMGLIVLGFLWGGGFGFPIGHDAWLWRGKLGAYFAIPLLGASFAWLTYTNFGSLSETWSLWRRNLLGLAGALGLVVVLTTAAYHRVWECFGPLEPAHGPARIAAGGFSTASNADVGLAPMGAGGNLDFGLSSDWSACLAVRLPEGRLWIDRLAYDQGGLWLRFGPETGFLLGGKWVSLSGNRFVPGSDWADGVATFCDTVAIRSDGTLWVSEKPRQPWAGPPWAVPVPEQSAALVRFGVETNWQDVIRESTFSVLLLKRDGSLWRWGPAFSFNEKKPWPGLIAFGPRRVGTDSDWARVLSDGWAIYAWKRDGRASVLHVTVTEPKKSAKVLVPDGLLRCPSFDGVYWRNVVQVWQFRVGVRDDGTIWAWNSKFALADKGGDGLKVEMKQIGKDAQWKGLAVEDEQLVALRAEGTLWRWPRPSNAAIDWNQPIPPPPPFQDPAPLSRHHDWVAVGTVMDGVLALAADGGLWYWWSADYGWAMYDRFGHQPMLANSRKPVLIENIFAKE